MIGRFLKALKRQKPSSETHPVPPAVEARPPESLPVRSGESHQYLSDQPIERAAQDRFQRAPFARRIADTIVKRTDTASIVIGLYAPWGDGKTSVLEMMREALDGNDGVITIRFNPWHFSSQEMLLRGFFSTLAEALDTELSNYKEKAGALLKEYGALLSLASLSVGGMLEVNPGEAAKGLGESLSHVGLDDLKARIESLLGKSGKRIVVLIDDIDRLDREETHSIFKLVKLSASFKHTCYVLAFDDEVVAAALGERYGAGGNEAGRSFLEKIIQVPLHLPRPDRISLRQLTFEGVNAALDQAEISIKEDRASAFLRHFVDGLEPKLQTPRLGKLYTNALTFSLPLLKGEVDIVDLMLIEGIRIFYPTLYEAIRTNSDLFLKGEEEEGQRRQQRGAPIEELLTKVMPDLSHSERIRIKDRLLKPLFPRIGESIYGYEWEDIWAKGQRACASKYFPRFFAYGVPSGDIADSQTRLVVETLIGADERAVRDLLQRFAEDNAIPRLIEKLRDGIDELTEGDAAALGRAIARNGDLLPIERGPMQWGGTRTQGAILVMEALRRSRNSEFRQALARNVVQDALPLGFALDCLRWMRYSKDQPQEDRLLPEAVEDELALVLVERIRAANAAQPLYASERTDAPGLYWTWKNALGRDAVSGALISRFEVHPLEVDVFIDQFVGTGWELESGLPRRSNLEREAYDQIDALLPIEFIVGKLRERFGEELDVPQYHLGDSADHARRFAHQLSFIYRELAKSKVS
jgi:predicted KAP-like P-loop ATPase